MMTGFTDESSAKNWLPPPNPSWPSCAAFISARPVQRAPVHAAIRQKKRREKIIYGNGSSRRGRPVMLHTQDL